MTIWPGDVVGDRFEIGQLTRRGSHRREDGSWDPGECIGWHCPLCDAPCSSMGHHTCPRAKDVAAA